MKHTSTRALYNYWDMVRGERPAPDRADIDPVGLRRELGDVFMLAADFVETLRFRLAGTRVCAVFGREIKGEAFPALWDETSRKTIDEVLSVLNNERIGAVAGLTGRTADGSTVELEMIVLPLAHAGHARIRAIGTLVPLAPPYWLGDKPVVELHLGALRHVGPDSENLEARRFSLAPSQQPDVLRETEAPLAPAAGGRLKHRFTVFSGGRDTPSGEHTG
ncbi:MAG: PAS domain-containing protein [Pseudolabrys sp.]|nr:PAS domain-containing protein [Pseudolabrys sp.]